ncbi:hypothetical protein [Streptomyces ochraceiscleroticus]|uniref:hypothetical protein n=1 Tax=Streptomyces ochraceiscleroticus TaxID=47761 RepID=UPI0012FEF847|nr:hypothetical protein [Streptomyces ochraceiscleroticus]
MRHQVRKGELRKVELCEQSFRKRSFGKQEKSAAARTREERGTRPETASGATVGAGLATQVDVEAFHEEVGSSSHAWHSAPPDLLGSSS